MPVFRISSEPRQLHKDVIDQLHNSNSKHYTVDVNSLDNIVNEIGVDRIDLLKLDTEGHELEVLRGAQ
jgi:FkbM family methyltransferase